VSAKVRGAVLSFFRRGGAGLEGKAGFGEMGLSSRAKSRLRTRGGTESPRVCTFAGRGTAFSSVTEERAGRTMHSSKASWMRARVRARHAHWSSFSSRQLVAGKLAAAGSRRRASRECVVRRGRARKRRSTRPARATRTTRSATYAHDASTTARA
jgi:hypothetical protein